MVGVRGTAKRMAHSTVNGIHHSIVRQMVYIRCIHRVYTSGVYIRCIHRVYTSGVYTPVGVSGSLLSSLP